MGKKVEKMYEEYEGSGKGFVKNRDSLLEELIKVYKERGHLK
jgi:hypothetical protein